ncbi:MAG: hypothetical protein JRH13_14490 [Deltaproteobacteria bacterium]|nr:hypothetical protein [Deltaproteobacteria bacterium]
MVFSVKALSISILLIAGGLIFYGMSRENHVVFLVGLCLGIGGYLQIRRRLRRRPEDE